MPARIAWTEAMDTAIRTGREADLSWEAIALVVGVSRHSVVSRGIRIGAKMLARPVAAVPVDRTEPSPLPAGHPASWGAIALPGQVWP